MVNPNETKASGPKIAGASTIRRRFLWFKKGTTPCTAIRPAIGGTIYCCPRLSLLKGQTSGLCQGIVARPQKWYRTAGGKNHHVGYGERLCHSPGDHRDWQWTKRASPEAYEAACRPEADRDQCGAPGSVNEVCSEYVGVSPCRSGQEKLVVIGPSELITT